MTRSISVIVVALLLAASAARAVDFDADRAWQYLEVQIEFGPRAPGTEGHEACANWLIAQLKERADYVQPHVFFHADPYSDETLRLTNIKASFQPQAQRRIALAAHWDTRPRADREKGGAIDTPILGANDGGSGVAVLLAIADALAAEAPEVGVDLLFFDGEDWGREGDLEQYIIGSRRYVLDHPGYRPDALILIDMVGDADLRIPMEGFSLQAAPGLTQRVFAKATALGLSAFDPLPGSQVYDDHVPFLEKGVPAVDLIDFEYGAWHTLADDLDQCSKASLDQVGTLLLHLLREDLSGGWPIR